ncbi:hypothetical protein MMC13_007836 [Lambiella insularis]|nr:hypothetical protein [Lambiella insularis]
MSTNIATGFSTVIARYYLEATNIATSTEPTLKELDCFTGHMVPADRTINWLITSFRGDPSRDQLIVWSRDEGRKWIIKKSFAAEPENETRMLRDEGWAGTTHSDPVYAAVAASASSGPGKKD